MARIKPRAGARRAEPTPQTTQEHHHAIAANAPGSLSIGRRNVAAPIMSTTGKAASVSKRFAGLKPSSAASDPRRAPQQDPEHRHAADLVRNVNRVCNMRINPG
jgi:hypothetical protein